MNWSRIFPYDFEIRFTTAGGQARMHYTSGNMVYVPFELWNIGIGTPDDQTDDYRMIPFVHDMNTVPKDTFDLDGHDHAVSTLDDDPETDWITFMDPVNKTPGTAGYDAWANALGDTTLVDSEVLARIVLVNLDGGSVGNSTWPANVNQLMPATGTVYRILTTKPNFPGDGYLVVAPSNANGEFVPFSISQNYPNPFNLSTRIPFSLQQETHMELAVYDILGRRVSVLRNEVMRPGSYEIEWNGKSDAGAVVSTGTYFFRMKTDRVVKTIKMLLLK
ncbi:MAG: T9SS type A sorting domain-containing protein [Bacteroidota bacterium]